MPDLSRLEALIGRLAEIDFSQSSEQDTREIAVNTVIGELGWDTLDRDEVAREYSVRGGRVDYCLRAQERNLVLIEVKRAGTDLTEHQEQLLRYAFEEGAPLAVLTDGLVWWLYLPRAGTSWKQRLFFRVNFREEQPDASAAVLYRFLNRDGVVSGAAQSEAEREFESQERDRRVRAALQDAWERVLGDPESLLREELSDTVKEISGYAPDRETIADFLQGVLGNRSFRPQASQRRPSEPLKGEFASRSNSKKQTVEDSRDESQRKSGGNRRLVGFKLDGVYHEESNWRRMLLRICEMLAQESGPVFVDSALSTQGRSRIYFSRAREELRSPRPIGETGLYVEGTLRPGRVERISRELLRKIRGSDGGFFIEVRT